MAGPLARLFDAVAAEPVNGGSPLVAIGRHGAPPLYVATLGRVETQHRQVGSFDGAGCRAGGFGVRSFRDENQVVAAAQVA